jgi:hypothetical protein
MDPPEWCLQANGSKEMDRKKWPSLVKDFTDTTAEPTNFTGNIKLFDNWTISSLSNVLGRAKSNSTSHFNLIKLILF